MRLPTLPLVLVFAALTILVAGQARCHEADGDALSLLLAAPECPEPEPPRPPLGYDLEIAAPPSVQPGDVMKLEVRPALTTSPPWALGALLRGRTVRGEETSDWHALPVPIDAVVVPEPGVGLGLAAGLLGLAWLRRRSH